MMVLPFRRSQEGRAPSYTLFGKLPRRPDFLAVHTGHPVVQEFDRMLQEGLKEVAGTPGWEAAYDAAPPVDFYYASRDGAWAFVGVLVPSRDQAGRRYPLVAGAVLPAEAVDGAAHLAPVAYEVFFAGLREHLANAVENSVEALACRQFLESHLHAGHGAAADLQLAQALVQRYLERQPAVRLCEVLATAGQGGRPAQALLNLAFYQNFLRRFDHAASDQMVLLPLAGEEGEAALVASAWLAVLAALWGGREGAKAWRGSYWRRAEGPPMLASCFVRMPKAYTKCIVAGTLGFPEALDLESEVPAWRTHPLYAETAYALDRLLADPDLTLAELVSFLRELGDKLRRDR